MACAPKDSITEGMDFRAAVVAPGKDRPDRLLSLHGSQDITDRAGGPGWILPAGWIGFRESWLNGRKWGTRDRASEHSGGQPDRSEGRA